MYFQIPDPVVRIFADIVQRMNDELLAGFQALDPRIEAINYQHGHPMEIVETLALYDKSERKRAKKYPLVLLVQDIKEQHGYNSANGRFANLNLRIFLVKNTKAEYRAADRQEKTFEPYLYPMYASLMNNMYLEPRFLIPDVYAIEHDKYDRMYWGKESLTGNTENALNDYVDAIELANMQVVQDLRYCTNPISQNT